MKSKTSEAFTSEVFYHVHMQKQRSHFLLYPYSN
jgi:hypothetical protein